MPYPDAPPQHKVNSFKCLTGVFEALWMTVQQVSQTIPSDHNMVALYCKAGRHQSYALLIAFLMWSSHIHEPQIWEAIISPLRNARLEHDSPCELIPVENLTEQERTKGHVAYLDFVRDYRAHLNAEFNLPAWPFFKT